MRNELAFEQIRIVVSDEDRHWQFFYGGSHIADYWPASGRGHIVGTEKSVVCASVSQAQKLAESAKKQMFKRIQQAMALPIEAPPGES